MTQTVPNSSFLRRAQGAADVAREDRRREPVAGVVRHRDRLVVAREPLHRDDRPEDLALHDLGVLRDVGDDRRLDEEAAVADRRAAGHDGRLAVEPLEEAEHALLLLLRDHRAHVDVVAVGRVADLHRLDDALGLREHVVVDRLADQNPGRRGAVLAGVPVAADLDRLGDLLRVGVVEHDHRRLAAELEVDALQGVARVPRDQLPGLDVAGERHEPDVRMADEPVADGQSVAGDDLHDARREDLLRELHEAERRQRRLLGRLEDLDVAGGERGAELPDDHHQRVVPGRDPGDDPERLAADDRRVALDVLACGLALERAGGAGEEAQVVGRERHLVADDRHRLADVQRLELRELVRVLVEHIGELQQQLHAVLRRLLEPVGQRALRGLDGPVDVCLRRALDLGDHLAGRGVQDLHRPALGLDPIAPDEVLVLLNGHAHELSPFRRFHASVSSLPPPEGERQGLGLDAMANEPLPPARPRPSA